MARETCRLPGCDAPIDNVATPDAEFDVATSLPAWVETCSDGHEVDDMDPRVE